MKDINRIILGMILLICLIIGFGSCKYEFWRLKYPDAPTWIFFIPSHPIQKMICAPLGSVITLKEPWSFRLWDESRNEKFIDSIRADGYLLARRPKNVNCWEICDRGEITLPVGTVLTISRIYVRQGNKDFDSISFFVRLASVRRSNGWITGRFWVRLEDANKLSIDP